MHLFFFIPPTDIPMPCPKKHPQRQMATVHCLKNRTPMPNGNRALRKKRLEKLR